MNNSLKLPSVLLNFKWASSKIKPESELKKKKIDRLKLKEYLRFVKQQESYRKKALKFFL